MFCLGKEKFYDVFTIIYGHFGICTAHIKSLLLGFFFYHENSTNVQRDAVETNKNKSLESDLKDKKKVVYCLPVKCSDVSGFLNIIFNRHRVDKKQ